MTTHLGFQVRLKVPYEEAVQKATKALKTEGFGVLTEIDVKATIKEKLDKDFRRYAILGACNPPLAHRALSANLDAGLLLPCNVIVYEEAEGEGSVIHIIDPLVMLGTLKDDQILCDVAEEAKAKLERVAATLKG